MVCAVKAGCDCFKTLKSAQTDPDVLGKIHSGHWRNNSNCQVVLDYRIIFQVVATSPCKTFKVRQVFS